MISETNWDLVSLLALLEEASHGEVGRLWVGCQAFAKTLFGYQLCGSSSTPITRLWLGVMVPNLTISSGLIQPT